MNNVPSTVKSPERFGGIKDVRVGGNSPKYNVLGKLGSTKPTKKMVSPATTAMRAVFAAAGEAYALKFGAISRSIPASKDAGTTRARWETVVRHRVRTYGSKIQVNKEEE